MPQILESVNKVWSHTSTSAKHEGCKNRLSTCSQHPTTFQTAATYYQLWHTASIITPWRGTVLQTAQGSKCCKGEKEVNQLFLSRTPIKSLPWQKTAAQMQSLCFAESACLWWDEYYWLPEMHTETRQSWWIPPPCEEQCFEEWWLRRKGWH